MGVSVAEGDVKVPDTTRHTAPPKKKHTGLIIGGLIVAGVVVYYFIKKRQSTTTAQTVTTSSTAPVYTYPSSGTTGYTGGRLYNALTQQQALANETYSAQVASLHTTFALLLHALQSQNNPGSATKPATNQGSGGATYTNSGQTMATKPRTTFTINFLTKAPSSTTFTFLSTKYTPIASYSQTLADFQKNIPVYVNQTGIPVKLTSAAQYKGLEHTGTHKYPQYTTYTGS